MLMIMLMVLGMPMVMLMLMLIAMVVLKLMGHSTGNGHSPFPFFFDPPPRSSDLGRLLLTSRQRAPTNNYEVSSSTSEHLQHAESQNKHLRERWKTHRVAETWSV